MAESMTEREKFLVKRLIWALEIQSQPLRLSGVVDENSPGGQGTATLPDGTYVDRGAYARRVLAEAKEAFSCPTCGQLWL